MIWLKKLLGRIRICQFCNEEFHIDELRYIKSKKVNVNFYRDYSGRVRVSTHSPRYECCKKCEKKHREEEDRRYGITPEMRENAKKLKKERDELLQKVRKHIR